MDKNKIIEAAAKLVQKGAYDKAIKEYQKVLDADPKEVRVLQKMGELYQKKNENGLAATFFSRVAETYASDGFFLKAVALYKQVLKLSPGLVEVNLKLAELHQQLGLVTEAMAYFQIVANHYDKVGDTKSSLDTLKRMVDLDPENVASRIKLAELYARENIRDQAVEEFRRSAEYLKRHNRGDDYLRVAERITALVPEDVALARELAATYLQKGDQKRALAKLQLCFKADPRDIDTLGLLAEAFQGLGQTSKTLSVYKELAKIYSESNQNDLAQGIWNKVASLDPHDPDLLARRGPSAAAPERSPVPPARQASAPAGPPPLTGDAKPSARQSPPPQATAPAAPGKENLAKLLTETDVYVKYGLHDKALDHLRKVFAVDPENLDAHEKAYQIYVSASHPKEASDQLLNVLRLMTRRGEVERAQPYLRTVMQKNPNHPEVPAFLAVLQRPGEDLSAPEPLADDAILVETGDEEVMVSEAPADALAPAPEDMALASADSDEVLDDEEGDEIVPEQEGDEEILEEAVVDEEVMGEELVEDAVVLTSDEEAYAEEGTTQITAVPERQDWPEEGQAVMEDEPITLTPEVPTQSGLPPPRRSAPPSPPARLGAEPVTRAGSPPTTLASKPVTKPVVPPLPARAAPAPPAKASAPPPPPARASAPPPPPAKAIVPPPPPAKAIAPPPPPAKAIAPPPPPAKAIAPPPPPAKAIAPPPPPAKSAPPSHGEESVDLELEEASFLLDQGVLDEARDILETILLAHPRNSRAKELLAQLDAKTEEVARSDSAASAPEERDAFDLAAELAEEVGELAQDNGGATESAGDDFQYSVEEVFAEFKKGLEKVVKPEDVDTHYDLGIAYKEMGLIDDAINEFTVARQGSVKKKKEVDCLTMMAMLQGMKGDHAGAVKSYQLALATEFATGETGKALEFELGMAWEANGSPDKALVHLQKVEAQDPAYRGVGDIVARLKASSPKTRKVGYL